MAKDLRLVVEYNLLDLLLDDLKDVGVKLEIVDWPEELSKFPILRRIRSVIKKGVSQDKGANIEFREAVIKWKFGHSVNCG